MSKIKSFIKTPYFYAILTVLVITIIIISVLGYIFGAISYKEPFCILYHRYPSANPTYHPFTPNMKGAAPGNFNGLEFIGWYYIDENGVEREFIASEFTPPENAESKYLRVYGRWKNVPPEEK